MLSCELKACFLKGERVTSAGHNMYCSHSKASQWVESKWIVGGEWAEPADVNSSVWCWCGRVSSGSAAEDWVHKEHNMSERKGKSHQSHTLEKDSLKRGASQRGRQDIWSFLEREMMSSDSFSSEKQQQIYQTMLRQPVVKLHRIEKEQIYQTMLKQPVIKLHRIGMCMFSSCHCTLCEYKRSSASSEHYQ